MNRPFRLSEQNILFNIKEWISFETNNLKWIIYLEQKTSPQGLKLMGQFVDNLPFWNDFRV